MTQISASSLLDAFETLFFVFDSDGRLVEWNEKAAAGTDLGGANPGTVTPAALFDGPDADRITEAVDRALETGSAVVEVRRSPSGGEATPYEIELRRLESDGEEATFVGVARDISTRAFYRERTDHRQRTLQRMYEIISDAERSFEAQVESLLELGREELDVRYGSLSRIQGDDYYFEIVASDDEDVQAGDVVPVSATNCEIVASDEKTLVLGDVARDAPEQTHRTGYAEWGISCYIGAPVVVDDGVYGTFCFYDTEPRQAGFSDWDATLVDLMSRWIGYELQSQRAKERLQRQNDKLERFASIVSHDLRNPLNVLSGSIELAAEDGASENIDRAQRAIDRMNTLIDNLLTLSRAGEAIDEVEPLDLASLAESAWEIAAASAGTVRIETDRTIVADRARLQQLLENLLSNAVEHADDGVTVTVGDLPRGFYVEDDGPGIPESERDQVFESGYTTDPSGTGFGLAIVTEIATAHGWSVSLTEGVSGGARFEFSGVEFANGTDEKPEP